MTDEDGEDMTEEKGVEPFNTKTTKAERKMMNRNCLLWEEKKRVRIVDSIRKYWAEHREKKEALRVKGELRYQQWAAKVGLSNYEKI
ncbi:unnamed protein product [Boreogadus saida]